MPVLECPICARTVVVAKLRDAPFRPFCSHRCKMIDLGRWLNGTYTISEPASHEDLEQLPEGDENGDPVSS